MRCNVFVVLSFVPSSPIVAIRVLAAFEDLQAVIKLVVVHHGHSIGMDGSLCAVLAHAQIEFILVRVLYMLTEGLDVVEHV